MFSIRIILGQHPKLFFILYSLKSRNRKLFVNEETQLVISAYPRCGNTYFYYALKRVNPSLKIAHHLHVPALTFDALNNNIPVVVIIRNPLDAISSLLIREKHLTINQGLKLYEKFHNELIENKDSILFLDFKEIIGDFKEVIRKMNYKFENLNLANYQNFDDETKENIFDEVELIDGQTNYQKQLNEHTVSRPSKSSTKVELKDLYKKRIILNKRYKECEIIYAELFKLAQLQKNEYTTHNRRL